MKKEEKDAFLKVFGEFIEYLSNDERAEFENIKKTLGINVNDIVIHEAMSRDLKRTLDSKSNQNIDRKKQDYLEKLCVICPEFYQVVKRLDQSYFSAERRGTALPEEMMTSHDWRLIFSVFKTVMK